MIELKKRQFLDFEKPIKDLYDQIEQLRITAEKSKTNMNDAIAMLEERVVGNQKQITDNLPLAKVQLSRHPDRPTPSNTSNHVLQTLWSCTATENEDDKTMVGGFRPAWWRNGVTIGQQKKAPIPKQGNWQFLVWP